MKLFHKLSIEEREFYLELFEESGVSAKAFCSEHDIAYRSLIAWRHGQRKKNATEENELESPESSEPPQQFIEVDCSMPRVLPPKSARTGKNPALLAELDLPAGITLRIYQPQAQQQS